jgi:hypothetical protein
MNKNIYLVRLSGFSEYIEYMPLYTLVLRTLRGMAQIWFCPMYEQRRDFISIQFSHETFS